MDLALLQITGLVETQAGEVQLSGAGGESGFFAHTLQSLMGKPGSLNAPEAAAPWSGGIDLASIAASFPLFADAPTSGTGAAPEPPVATSRSADGMPAQPGWCTLLAAPGEMMDPEKVEPGELALEEGRGPGHRSVPPFLQDFGVAGGTPSLEAGGIVPGDLAPKGEETEDVPHEPGEPLRPPEQQEVSLVDSPVNDAEPEVTDRDSRGVSSAARNGLVLPEPITAPGGQQGVAPEMVRGLKAVETVPFAVHPGASGNTGFMEPVEEAVQAEPAVALKREDGNSLSGDQEKDPKGAPAKDRTVLTAAMPVRGDSGRAAVSGELSAGKRGPDGGEPEAVVRPGAEQSHGRVEGEQERAAASHRAAEALSPIHDGAVERGHPSSQEESGVMRTDHGSRSVNSLTDAGTLEYRRVSETVSRPEMSAERVLGQIEPQLQRMVLKGRDKLFLQLEPASLGKLKMEVSLSDQGVTAKMTTDSAAAREVIFTHIHALKEALLDQGFRVDNIQVHYQEEMADSGFKDANQPHGDGARQQLRDEGGRRYASTHEEVPSPGESDETMAQGRVNVFA